MVSSKDIRKCITDRSGYVADGENIVRAQVEKDGKVYEDEIRWMYTGEKRREADASYEKEEHAGF